MQDFKKKNPKTVLCVDKLYAVMSSSEKLPQLTVFSSEGTAQHLENTIFHTKQADIYSVSKNTSSCDWLDRTAVISVTHTATMQSRSTSWDISARSRRRAQAVPPFFIAKKYKKQKTNEKGCGKKNH